MSNSQWFQQQVLVVLMLVFVYVFASEKCKPDGECSTSEIDTLQLVIVVTRHGNRAATTDFPNNPYPLSNKHFWPYGEGQLTTFGRVQLYNLGVKLRSRYDGFLNSIYYDDDFRATSTNIDRTMQSAASLLAGLYPPAGYEVWDQAVNWQPIPVFTDSEDKNAVLTSCLKYNQEFALAKAKYNEMFSANVSKVTSFISRSSNTNISGSYGLDTAWENIYSQDIEGYALPGWAYMVYPQPMKNLMSQMYILYNAWSDEIVRLTIGLLYKDILSALQQPNQISQKMLLFSSHDTSLIGIQKALNISEDKIIGLIEPGSAMIFELYKNETTDGLVKIFYVNGNSRDLTPLPLPVPGCGHYCDINHLVDISQKYTNITDFWAECSTKSSNTFSVY